MSAAGIPIRRLETLATIAHASARECGSDDPEAILQMLDVGRALDELIALKARNERAAPEVTVERVEAILTSCDWPWMLTPKQAAEHVVAGLRHAEKP